MPLADSNQAQQHVINSNQDIQESLDASEVLVAASWSPLIQLKTICAINDQSWSSMKEASC